MIPRSLTSRLIFLYCVILLLLGSAFLGFTVLSFRHYSREVITNLLEVRSQDIWRLSRTILDQPDEISAVIAHHFSPESQDRFIRVRSNDRVLYRSGEPLSGAFSAKDVPLNLPVNMPARLSDRMVVYSRSFTDPRGRSIVVDAGQVQISGTIQDRLTKSLFVGLPLMLVMAGIAGWLVMRRALMPIEVMITAAENYTFNQSQKRLPTMGTEPRIEALGLALNRLLDRLDSAYSHVSRFTADAAHELRTPLTIIRGELELVARKEPLSKDVDQSIQTVLEEMTRLSELVDALIALARMDSFWGKTSHSAVDLRSLAQETVEQMRLLPEDKGLMLTCVSGPAVHVVGDHGRLKQVLVNLLDNAVKYTKEGGHVSVDVYTAGMMGGQDHPHGRTRRDERRAATGRHAE